MFALGLRGSTTRVVFPLHRMFLTALEGPTSPGLDGLGPGAERVAIYRDTRLT